MGEAVGFSHLYPIVPIMNSLSMVLMLLLLPGFWKTRIVALVSVVGWVFIGNLISFLGMTYWRGHTNDAPVWANVLTTLGRTWYCGFFTSAACFAHFTWQRLQPLSARDLYDTRRRNNLIHFFLTAILPVLWAPLYLLSCNFRYLLIEDFGPARSVRRDWPGFVVLLPVPIGYATVGIFSVLALVRYWHAKLDDVESDPPKHHPSVRTRKLLLMAVVNTLLAVYGIWSQISYWSTVGWWWLPAKSLAESISSLQLVLTVTRTDLDTSWEFTVRSRIIITTISAPLLGFYVFAWFGCGEEARKAYRDDLLKFGRLVGVVGTLPFSWSAISLRKSKSHQGLLHPLPLIPLDAPQLMPYIALPREHGPQLPVGPTMDPSNPVGNVVDSKRRAPPKDPVRRPSTRKPLFVPLDPTNTAAYAIAPVPNPPARRLSYHKPAFRPLDPANPIPNRRQENLATHPQARRLSYHKPPFKPLVPADANTRGVIPDVLGTSMPIVDVQRRPESGTTGFLAASTADVPPPPFLNFPTSTAPSPLSYQRPATPAPPYQDLHSFFDHSA